ncbi:hypothetical protein [Phormidium tenue]|uniref:Uncharacterized protein n=1 Tax=Phormidium tenue FACHB-1050 TaxID=2692857 RepID=A0ABR8C8J9_9CYAN|nr:hypothetical protein [Phormidium tenue]MBD2316690.1 hypothetical protein [Phormidium tenue FACHB-1050]
MQTETSVRDRLSRTFTQSAIALKKRITQDENQQTFAATLLDGNKVQLPDGSIRTAYNQGTRQVLIGDSVTVVFPLHSQIGFYTSKIS